MLSKKITTSQEDYLEAILKLSQNGYNVRSKDIANALSVHRSTVTASLKNLSQKRLINYKPYEAVSLTAKGEILAQNVSNRHKILCRFFVKVLEIDKKNADEIACKIEHSASEEVITKLSFLTSFFTENEDDESLIKLFKDFCNKKGNK